MTHFTNLNECADTILRQIEQEDSSFELARVKKNTQALLTYRGRQRGFWVDSTFIPYDLSLITGDTKASAILTSDNIFRLQVRSLLKEWVRSRARLRVNAKRNSRRHKAAARYANFILQAHQDRIQTERFRHQEGKFCFLTGNYFRYSYAAPDVSSPTIQVPKYASISIWMCDVCEIQVKGEEGYCTVCGSPARQVINNKLEGYVRVPISRPQTTVVDSRAVKIPLSARSLKDAVWLRWIRAEERHLVENKYGTDLSRGSVIGNEILMHILATERENGASEYTGGITTEYDRVEVSDLWLRPAFYANIYVEGESLANRFPDGMKLTFVNKRCVSIEPDTIDAHWLHGTYDELPENAYGDGLDDAIIDMHKYNELRAMRLEALLYGGMSKRLFNSRAVDVSLINNDSSIVPLNKNVDVLYDIRNTIIEAPPVHLSPDLELELSTIERNMRAKTGATPILIGQADEELKTATGMSIVRDSALAVLGLPLSIRAAIDVDWAYQILALEQQCFIPQYHIGQIGDFSRYEAESFFDCDVKNDLEITVEPQSWIPRTEAEIRADFERFLSLGLLNAQVPTAVKRKAMEIYKVPLELDTVFPAIRIAEQRLDTLLKLGEQLPKMSSYVDETISLEESVEVEQTHEELAQAIASKIPVRKYDAHQTIIEVYVEALTTDEVLYAHPVISRSIELLIERHKQMIVAMATEEAANVNAAAMAAAAPQAAAPESANPQEEALKLYMASHTAEPNSTAELTPGVMGTTQAKVATSAKPTAPEEAVSGSAGIV